MGEVTTKTKFQALYIDPVCKKKLQYWADAASGEVSGLVWLKTKTVEWLLGKFLS